jgi:hypothetical protein
MVSDGKSLRDLVCEHSADFKHCYSDWRNLGFYTVLKRRLVEIIIL